LPDFIDAVAKSTNTINPAHPFIPVTDKPLAFNDDTNVFALQAPAVPTEIAIADSAPKKRNGHPQFSDSPKQKGGPDLRKIHLESVFRHRANLPGGDCFLFLSAAVSNPPIPTVTDQKWRLSFPNLLAILANQINCSPVFNNLPRQIYQLFIPQQK
jgi:hypothetical protein